MDLMQRGDVWYNINMENFGSGRSPEQGGFNKNAYEQGLFPALVSFELLAGKEGKRIQIDNPLFSVTYPPDEIRADSAESEAFFRKYFKEDKASFRPSMLAEELVKIGGSFSLFGDKAKIEQASLYDDYKNNADFIVKIKNEIRDRKDEKFLHANERFILDVTTDTGDRVEEKVKKISAELRNGKLTNIKYSTDFNGALQDVPRFVLQINEEELFEFFKKAKPTLDNAGGINRKSFGEQYDIFSFGACEKILTGARTQIEFLVQSARSVSFPENIAEHIVELLSSHLGGFYQALEYVDGINSATLNAVQDDKRTMASRYIYMIKKILSVGVAIERVLEEKEKRTSTQQRSEALH